MKLLHQFENGGALVLMDEGETERMLDAETFKAKIRSLILTDQAGKPSAPKPRPASPATRTPARKKSKRGTASRKKRRRDGKQNRRAVRSSYKNEVITIMRDTGRPMTSVEIAEQLKWRNVRVTSKNPSGAVTVMMGTYKNTFQRVGRKAGTQLALYELVEQHACRNPNCNNTTESSKRFCPACDALLSDLSRTERIKQIDLWAAGSQ